MFLENSAGGDILSHVSLHSCPVPQPCASADHVHHAVGRDVLTQFTVYERNNRLAGT